MGDLPYSPYVTTGRGQQHINKAEEIILLLVAVWRKSKDREIIFPLFFYFLFHDMSCNIVRQLII